MPRGIGRDVIAGRDRVGLSCLGWYGLVGRVHSMVRMGVRGDTWRMEMDIRRVSPGVVVVEL